MRKRKGKRADDLKGLPVKRIDLRLTEEQLKEKFPMDIKNCRKKYTAVCSSCRQS